MTAQTSQTTTNPQNQILQNPPKNLFANPPLTKTKIREILHNRNKKWDYTSLSSLPNPYTLKDCELASQCLAKAIAKHKQILIIGDYDVDGIVASVVMMRFFYALGYANVRYIIPNRFRDGYGVSKQILEQNPSEIVITVDNGINAFEAADFCAKQKRTLIITDHHLPKMQESKQILPNADFVINPMQSDCGFPQKEICGALVAWYLCAGIKIALQKNLQNNLQENLQENTQKNAQENLHKNLHKHLQANPQKSSATASSQANPNELESSAIKSLDLAPLLEFVMLATIADMMPLKHINKTIVLYGIKRLKTSHFPCINALKSLLKTPFITASDISFSITPLLNAAGRMGEGRIASEFLLDSSEVSLGMLKSINDERKKCAKDTLESALKNLQTYPSALIALGQWNEGVLGIVASKLAKQFNKCAFVLTKTHKDGCQNPADENLKEQDLQKQSLRAQDLAEWDLGAQDLAGQNLANENITILKGSARSVGNANVVDLLSGAQDMMENFGGHKNAAGLTLKAERYEDFCAYVEGYKTTDISDMAECDECLGEIDSREIGVELLEILECFEPYGQGNPKPIFIATLQVECVEIIKEVHRKITFKPLDLKSSNACTIELNQNLDSKKSQDFAQNYRQDSSLDSLKAMYFFCEKQIKKGEILTAKFTLQRDAFSGKATMIIIDCWQI
ncbi:single-stranded-DNA-specific exonuclease RecJ [Helicobacter sp. T3_23-1056]